MYILITGGLGYIGSHVACYYLEKFRHFDIIIVDNLVNTHIDILNHLTKLTNTNIIYFQYDLTYDVDKVNDIFSHYDIYAVVHCAGLKSVPESIKSPLMYYENNIISTINLLNIMSKHKCYNLVFSSSATVYGDAKVPLTEDSTIGKGITNSYGQSKFFQEQILKDICTSNCQFKTIILRYFNPIGEHRSGYLKHDMNKLPNNIFPYLTKVARGEVQELKVYGNDYHTSDGTCIRDFVDIEDLCDAHIKVLQSFEIIPSGVTIYNVGTGKGTSVMDLIRAFERANRIKINYSFYDRRLGDRDVLYCDSTKIQKELDWKCKKTLDESCKITI